MNGNGATTIARLNAQQMKQRRRFVTPEGVDLSLEIASAGARFGALVIDLGLMVIALILMIWIAGSAAPSVGEDSLIVVIWLLGFFLLRNGWFMAFELGPRAATPGKRLLGIRVVARSGGRLEVASVVARNIVREIEIFLPVTFLFMQAGEGDISGATAIIGMIWTGVFSFFLLFNRDRMRLGDLIGGTWVVSARQRKMRIDLSTVGDQADSALRFEEAELAIYGVYELQELERVLRERDAKTMGVVADTIRQKIGRPMIGEDSDFLIAYYRQLRARQERDLLMGRRRENKFEAVR